MNGHFIQYKDKNLQICYGTFIVTAELRQNGEWCTGTSSKINYGQFAKPFGHLQTLNLSLSSGDWASIVHQSADNNGVTEVTLAYSTPYSSRDFRIDYVAFGQIV